MTNATSLYFGSERLYFAGLASHPEHNGKTWESVIRPVYASRMTMDRKKWELSYHMGGSIFCPMLADFDSKASAMHHALAVQSSVAR